MEKVVQYTKYRCATQCSFTLYTNFSSHQVCPQYTDFSFQEATFHVVVISGRIKGKPEKTDLLTCLFKR